VIIGAPLELVWRVRRLLVTKFSGTDDDSHERRVFLHTVGLYRADGSYVVERRRATSAGHRTVFDSFDDLCALFDSLPREFDAGALGRPGVSGGRRHLLLWHLAEHPAFDCRLVSRQPLTAEKTVDGG
jgi:hypothetical protein